MEYSFLPTLLHPALQRRFRRIGQLMRLLLICSLLVPSLPQPAHARTIQTQPAEDRSFASGPLQQEPEIDLASEQGKMAALQSTTVQSTTVQSTAVAGDLTIVPSQEIIASGERITVTVRVQRSLLPIVSGLTLSVTLPAALTLLSDAPLQMTLPQTESGIDFTQTYEVMLADGYVPPADGAVLTLQADISRENALQPVVATALLGVAPAQTPAADAEMAQAIHDEFGTVLRNPKEDITLLIEPNVAASGTEFQYTKVYRWDEADASTPITQTTPGSNQLYFPLMSINASGGATSIVKAADATDVPIALNVDGVSFYYLWDANATLDGVTITQFPDEIRVVVDVSTLAATGINFAGLRVWTRETDTEEWDYIKTIYDPVAQTVTAWIDHFSEFGLGEGLSRDGELLPNMSGFNTDLFSGSMGFSQPINTPSGTGGLNPGLSLSYSSAGIEEAKRNGGDWNYQYQGSVAGYGWDIGGVNYVTKVIGDNAAGVKVEKYFVVLNGTKVEVSKTDGWSSPEIFAKVAYSPWTTANDGTTKLRNIGEWLITTADGTLYRFGKKPAASEINVTASGNPNQLWSWTTAQTKPYRTYMRNDSQGKSEHVVVDWYLSEVIDRQGNRMEYSYQSERRDLANSCGSDVGNGNYWYNRHVRPTEVRWSNGASSSEMMLRTTFAYTSGRTDNNPIGYNSNCDQIQFTDHKLRNGD